MAEPNNWCHLDLCLGGGTLGSVCLSTGLTLCSHWSTRMGVCKCSPGEERACSQPDSGGRGSLWCTFLSLSQIRLADWPLPVKQRREVRVLYKKRLRTHARSNEAVPMNITEYLYEWGWEQLGLEGRLMETVGRTVRTSVCGFIRAFPGTHAATILDF